MTAIVATAPLRLDLSGRELEPLAPLLADAAAFAWPLDARVEVRLERRSGSPDGRSRVEAPGGLALEVDPGLEPPGDEGPLALEAWALRTVPPPWPALVRVSGDRHPDLGGSSAVATALLAALSRAGQGGGDPVELARAVVARASRDLEPRAGIAAARQGSPRIGITRLGERTIVAAPSGGAVARLLSTRLLVARDAAAGRGPSVRSIMARAFGEEGLDEAIARAAEASRALAEVVLVDAAASVVPLIARESRELESIVEVSPRDRDVSAWLAGAGAVSFRRLGEAGLVFAIAGEGREQAVREAAVESGLVPIEARLGTRGLEVREEATT